MNSDFIMSLYSLFFSTTHALWIILSAIGLYFLLQIVSILWLWFAHDVPIKRIHDTLLDIPSRINESNRGRGVVTSSQEQQINAEEKPLKIELEKKKLNRQLFIDRIHLLSFLKNK